VRVLVVTYSPVVGGAELILLDFARGVDGEVVLANPSGPLVDRAVEAGLGVHPLTHRRRQLRATLRDRVAGPFRLAGHAREIRSAVRAVAPDVVVGWGLRSALAGRAATWGDGARFIFQHNDLLPGPAIGVLARAMSRRADAVSVLSRTIADDLDPSGRLGTRLQVVRPGVDLDRFAATSPPPSEPRALLLGAIASWKRPDLALEIVARAADRVPDIRLVVAGQPIDAEGEDLLRRLRKRADEPDLAGRVEFRGWTDDTARALQEATCLLHCSDREPLGLVLMEALASGRPVVAPAAGGPKELIDERVGRLYPPGDAAAGADALAAVVGTPGLAESLGRAARERAAGEFGQMDARRRFGQLVQEVATFATLSQGR